MPTAVLVPVESLFHPEAKEALLQRLGCVTPESERRWGRMTAHQMICHLGDQLCVALGEIPVASPPRGVTTPLVRWAAFRLPWPKGRLPVAPEYQITRPTKWSADVERLGNLLERFAHTDPEGRWGVHPALGPLSGHQWAQLSYKHLDYHFGQFGA